MDGFGRVFGFEEEKLRNDDVSSVVGDGSIDADNALFEEAREDVVSSLPSGRVLNHHWDETVRTTTALGLSVPSMEQQLPRQRVRASGKTSHGSQHDPKLGFFDLLSLIRASPFWFCLCSRFSSSF